MSKGYGRTWWGKRWLDALNTIDYSNRLPRGASYARKGAVEKIKIEKNKIIAKVQGSRTKPYSVDIILPPFFDPELSNFLDEVARKPFVVSKLLNRELPTELLELAENHHLKVFPKQWTDFKMQCSCPDWAVPCKHLAAVIYKLSQEIDNNPFLVFELHLVDLLSELNKRGLNFNTEIIEIPKIENLYFNKNKKKSKTEKIEYNPKKAYTKLSFSKLSTIHESLFDLLESNPVFYNTSGDFKEKYSSVLRKAIKTAQQFIQGKTNFTKLLHIQETEKITVHAQNKVEIDEHFKASVWVNETDFSILDFMGTLNEITTTKLNHYQPSTVVLHSLFRLALHLISHGAIVPQILLNDHKEYAIRWLPALLSKEVRELCQQLEDILPPDIFWWKTSKTQKVIKQEVGNHLLSVFLTELVSLFVGKTPEDLYLNLFFKKETYSFTGVGENAFPGGIQTWLQKYYLTQGNYKIQLVVSENGMDFGLKINILGLLDDTLSALPLKRVMTEPKFTTERLEIMQTMALINHYLPEIEKFINEKEEEIFYSNENFTRLLLNVIPVLRLLNIEVLLPKSLQEILKPKASVKLKVKKQNKSFIRLDQILDFEWKIAIGDEFLTEEEFKKLLKNSDERLIRYKSNYFLVEEAELSKLYKQLSAQEELSSFEMLRAALSGEYAGAKVELTAEVLDEIQKFTEIEEIPLPKGINAQLRPYQHRGFSWMYRNASVGFGSVIADDMGLGKTLQVITTLLKFKEEGKLQDKKILIIVPTGLLTNWQAEIEKFAPALSVCLFHGTNRKLDKTADLVLTSYGIVRTEVSNFKKKNWLAIVIDEAQNIKNENTAQTKAVKSIKADHFIAMSGTPVENRLSELWSIMDYSNRGLLGNSKYFNELFGTPIETYNDENKAIQLKQVTAPFMMRRLKTDKSIISDLPDKIEIDVFGNLSPQQASLYQKTVEEALMTIDALDPTDSKQLFARQGLVLQMIMALKQICNHPTQFLKNKELEAKLSGKMELLFEKLDSIIESNEKVLIFTQFKEMGDLLQHFIHERYNEQPMFYHGGSTIKQREDMVERFQNNPSDRIFILSLKAAGTGLNLTAANHVIHYDLWWNPAVEAQATDRAYRIGQKNNVIVHRFITKNTFEERINEMIQSKKALAQMTVSTGENWIGNLNNQELKDLFQIGT